MKLTKDSKTKISDAWQYNSAGTCRAAMSELDKYVDALLNSDTVEVDDENIILRNFSEFIIWKNKKWDLGQIPILTNKEINNLIPIINKLITDTKINKIKFNEIDPHNRRFRINIISEEGQFSLDLGNIKNFENLPCYTFKVADLKFYFISDKNYELKYISSEFNTNEMTILFNELELK
ncbi:MAG: hypothetical protein V4608_16750 [Bacteroidota bacterium]